MVENTQPQQPKPQVDPKGLHECYHEERVYFRDPVSGRCFTQRDLRIELNPKTLAPLV